jgi:hypothetical protein
MLRVSKSKITSVNTGFADCSPIALIQGENVGICPGLQVCTGYVVHNFALKEGYIGHVDQGPCEDPLEHILCDLEDRLVSQLQAPIALYGYSHEALHIVVTGAKMATLFSGPFNPPEYQDTIRRTVLDVFARTFVRASISPEWNDAQPDSVCLLYLPRNDLVHIVQDDGFWEEHRAL